MSDPDPVIDPVPDPDPVPNANTESVKYYKWREAAGVYTVTISDDADDLNRFTASEIPDAVKDKFDNSGNLKPPDTTLGGRRRRHSRRQSRTRRQSRRGNKRQSGGKRRRQSKRNKH